MEQNEFYCRGFAQSRPPAPPCPGPGEGWARSAAPAGCDPVVDQALRRARCGYLRRESDGGFSLAYPLSCRSPFPLPPLFCFARARSMGGRGWWVFSFDSAGTPRLAQV